MTKTRELTDAEFDAIVAEHEAKERKRARDKQDYRKRVAEGLTKNWADDYPGWKFTRDGQKHTAEKDGVILTAWSTWRIETMIKKAEGRI